MRVKLLAAALVLAACVPRAARIPPKAADEMHCPEAQLTLMEVEHQGDSGPHLVMGCGKKAVYELNNMGDWVLNAPIQTDPSHIKVESPPDAPAVP